MSHQTKRIKRTFRLKPKPIKSTNNYAYTQKYMKKIQLTSIVEHVPKENTASFCSLSRKFFEILRLEVICREDIESRTNGNN